MPNILVRDLPAEVHAELTRRAAARGLSLQQYLTAELTRLTQVPSREDVLARIEAQRGGTVGLQQAVDDLATGRGAR